jgi:spoIIIJ-associated protein
MVYQFEGKTEKEAIETAARELGLESDKFDIEILETQKGSLFKKGFVRIEVHTNSTPKAGDEVKEERRAEEFVRAEDPPAYDDEVPVIDSELEKQITDFVSGVIERMGFAESSCAVAFHDGRKIGLKIASPYSSEIIGKKGKNLDALQLLVNNYAVKLGKRDARIILDSENYRVRREEAIVRLAYSVADKVKTTRKSLLLEPMNPFERRIVHTTLADIADIETKSEGEGTYKQVRVMFRGAR